MHRRGESLSTPRKVVLLGNSGVGKTSLARRLPNGAFDSSMNPKIGPTNSTSSIEVDGREVKITLWDTAGREKYRSIVPLYIRGVRSAIIVASVDSPDSFYSIRDWIELLNSCQEDPVQAILAINKTDLKDPLSSDISPLISSNKKFFASCFFVSALNGDNCEHLFREVARLASRGSTNMDAETTTQVDPSAAEPPACC
jgi:small GTP-binding protein